jgi:hypothetical protein
MIWWHEERDGSEGWWRKQRKKEVKIWGREDKRERETVREDNGKSNSINWVEVCGRIEKNVDFATLKNLEWQDYPFALCLKKKLMEGYYK